MLLKQESAFGSGGPEPDRAEPGFQATGTGLGLDINRPAGLGLKVCGLNIRLSQPRVRAESFPAGPGGPNADSCSRVH